MTAWNRILKCGPPPEAAMIDRLTPVARNGAPIVGKDAGMGCARGLRGGVVRACCCLLENPELEQGFEAAVAALGEGSGLTRVYVKQRVVAEEGWKLLSEWGEAGAVGSELAIEILAGHVYQSAGFGARELIAPIEIDGGVWGCIGIEDLEGEGRWPEAEVAEVEAVARVIAAAVRRDAARGPDAVAEAMARAAEAHRISDFLSTALGNLAEGADLQESIELIVMGLAKEVGAAHVSLLRRDARARTLVLDFCCLDGRIRRGPSGEEMPLLAAPFPEDITPAWRIMTERRGLYTLDMAPIAIEEFAWPGSIEYARNYGLSDIGIIILFVGEEPVGAMGLGLRGGRRFKPSDKPFIEGVARQAALAIRMADLAREAGDAAIEMEQQKSALDRTAELAVVNQTLRSTLGTLATGRSGQVLLEGILNVLQATMGAVSVALRIREPRVLATIADDRYEVEPCGAFPGFAALMAARKPLYLRVSEDQSLTKEVQSSFAAQGIVSQFVVPLLLGEELIGVIMVRLPKDQCPAGERIELAIALGHQATLAIRMTQLAAEAKEEARAKAVSEERAAMARELHDTLLQSFTGITLQLRGLRMRAAIEDSSLALFAAIEQQATEAVQEARMALGEIRNLSKPVHLAQELRHLCETEQKESRREGGDLLYSLRENGEPRNVPAFAAMDLIRIVREALRNASLHSDGTMVETVLCCQPECISVLVRDDGCGFDLKEALCKPGHYGIGGMQERARQIGASLSIYTGKGQGTSILIQYREDRNRLPAPEVLV